MSGPMAGTELAADLWTRVGVNTGTAKAEVLVRKACPVFLPTKGRVYLADGGHRRRTGNPVHRWHRWFMR